MQENAEAEYLTSAKYTADTAKKVGAALLMHASNDMRKFTIPRGGH